MILSKVSEEESYDQISLFPKSPLINQSQPHAYLNKKRASLRAARIATGGKQTRFTGRRRNGMPTINPSRAKAKFHWSILRAAVKEKRAHVADGVFVPDDESCIEFVSLKQGFMMKQSIKHNQSLLLVDQYVSSVGRVTDSSVLTDKSQEEQPKMKPLNLIGFDRLHRMAFWELKQPDKAIYKGAFKGVGDLSHFIFISKCNLVVTCYFDDIIKFYDFNLEYICDFQASHVVQFIRYNENSNALILVGVHQVTIYSIPGNSLREPGFASRDCRIDLIFLSEFISPFGPEEWIKAVVFHEKTDMLSIAIGTNLLVFDYQNGVLVENIVNATDRPITCMQYHHFYGYTLLGTTSGKVKVLNLSYATVFDFNQHPKEITGLSVYPKSTLFLTSSKDKTFRLFDLKTLDELYCHHNSEIPLSIMTINEKLFHIAFRNRIEIWDLKHIHTSYLITSSPVKNILRVHECVHKPARILIRTDDEVIRLISPPGTQPITMMLPFINSDSLKSIAYSTNLERIFLLRTRGDIWLISTEQNPCRLVDIWNSGELTRENITSVCVFEGVFPKWNRPAGYNATEGFTFILGSTDNGQILVFENDGYIGNRTQIHEDAIIHISAYPPHQVIVTSGANGLIRFTKVKPFTEQVLSVILSINCHYSPSNIAIIDHTICVSSNAHHIDMYRYSLTRKIFQRIESHSTGDDHTEKVTNIIGVPKLSVFISVSLDMTLKIWNCENVLLREIIFDSPLETVCLCSPKGDILFGIKDRVDIIKYHQYLPASYIRGINRNSWTDIKAEDIIPFDTSVQPSECIDANLLDKRKRPRYDIERDSIGMFRSINLREPNALKKFSSVPRVDDNIEYKRLVQSILSDLEKFMKNMEIQNAKNNMAINSKITVEPPQDDKTFNELDLMRRFRQRQHQRYSLSDILTNFKPDSSGSFHNIQLNPDIPPIDSKTESAVNDTVCLESPVPPKLTPGKKTIKIYFGGKIPNSKIYKTIDEYKSAHHITISGPIPIRGKNSVPESKEKRAFNPLDVTVNHINIVQEECKCDSASIRDLEENTSCLQNDKDVKFIPKSAESAEPVVVPTTEQLPELVTKFLEKQWFPLEKIFLEEDLYEIVVDDQDQKKESHAKISSHHITSKSDADPQRDPEPHYEAITLDQKPTEAIFYKDEVEYNIRPLVTSNEVNDKFNVDDKAITKLDFLSQNASPLAISGSETVETRRISKRKPRESLILEAPSLVQQRRYSIQPTPANMSNILLQTFKTESTENQRHIVSFLSDIPIEEKASSKLYITSTYIDQISNYFFKRISAQEETNISLMLKEILKYSPNHSDIIPILVILTQLNSDALRLQALSLLKRFGCHMMQNYYVIECFNSIYIQVRSSLMRIDKQSAYLLGSIKYWLKYHLKAYILRTLDRNSEDYKSVRKIEVVKDADEKLLGRDFIAKLASLIPLDAAFKKDKLNDKEIFDITRPSVLNPVSDIDVVIEKNPQYRLPVAIINDPTNIDFAQAINFYAVQSEKIFAEKEAERLAEEEKIRLENERVEKERIKHEKAVAAKEAKEKERLRQEEEKRANAEAIKRKIADNKKRREEAQIAATVQSAKMSKEEYLPHKSRKAMSQLRRRSPCHESRERMDQAYWNPPAAAEGPKLANSLALYYAKLNKSMPIERISLSDPFLNPVQDKDHQNSNFYNTPKSKKDVKTISYSKMAVCSDTDLDYIRTGSNKIDQHKPQINLPVLEAPIIDKEPSRDSYQKIGSKSYFMPGIIIACEKLHSNKPKTS